MDSGLDLCHPMSLCSHFPLWLLVLALGCVAVKRIIQRAILVSGPSIKMKHVTGRYVTCLKLSWVCFGVDPTCGWPQNHPASDIHTVFTQSCSISCHQLVPKLGHEILLHNKPHDPFKITGIGDVWVLGRQYAMLAIITEHLQVWGSHL